MHASSFLTMAAAARVPSPAWIAAIRADERKRVQEEKEKKEAQYRETRASGYVPSRCYAQTLAHMESLVRGLERDQSHGKPVRMVIDPYDTTDACARVTRAEFENLVERMQQAGLDARGKMNVHDMYDEYIGHVIVFDRPTDDDGKDK